MPLNKVSIIGLGLIGGSLGLALKKAAGDRLEITGFARRTEVAEMAIKRGAVDAVTTNMEDTVSNAELVIVATPVNAIPVVFREIAPDLIAGAIVTDTGSTKAAIMHWAREFLPDEWEKYKGNLR